MITFAKFLSPQFYRNILAVCFVLFAFTGNAAEDFPERATRLVTDYTGTLRADELQSLENKLVAFEDTTSMQIAVVMMTSVGNYDISDYAVQLFNKWKIGDKSNNSGVLLLVAKDDRKVWITTGYGMEGVFQYKASGKKSKGDKGGIFPFLMVAFIFIVIIFSQVGRAKRYGRKNNLGFWAAWALLNAASNRSHGSWGGFTGGGGFGGGGGGGFGGFGGGSSGGGGAGGSW